MPGPLVLGGLDGFELVPFPDPDPDPEPDPEPEPEGDPDPEPDPPPLPPPVLPPDDGVVVVVVGVLVVVGVDVEVTGVCGHDSDMLDAGAGRVSEDSGAPGGSEKVSTCPVISLTVTVQFEPEAADAAGSAATPATAPRMPSMTSATFSFARLNTVALSPPDGS